MFNIPKQEIIEKAKIADKSQNGGTKYSIEQIVSTAQKYQRRGEFKNNDSNIYDTAIRRGILDIVCEHMTTSPSLESALLEVNNYRCRSEFKKSDSRAYKVIQENGLLDKFFPLENVPHAKYSEEQILADSEKYKSREEWYKNNRGTYNAAYKQGILNRLFGTKKQKKHTFESVVKDALEYQTRWSFEQQNSSSYNYARSRGWLDEICKHMKPKKIERRHTNESLAAIAKQYKSRAEFQKKDLSAYHTAQNRHILDDICSHMVIKAYSIPQLITKFIFEALFNRKCSYNNRKVIKPLELDIYFEGIIAIEYCGKAWHNREEVIERDARKDVMCLDKNIPLLRIIEKTKNYEEDIKAQISDNLEFINKCSKLSLKPEDVSAVCVDYKEIYNFMTMDDIKEKIKTCKSIKEFQKKYSGMYHILTRSDNLALLDPIRTIKCLTDEELKEECLKFDDYTQFLLQSPNLYQTCYRRGLLHEFTSHMTQRHPKRSKTIRR